MNTTRPKAILALFLAFDTWLILDLWTKYWAVSEDFRALNFVDGWFYLVPFQTNDGIAFGIEIPMFIQIAASMVILFLLLKLGLDYIKKSKKPLLASGILGLVMAGGIGNLIGRVWQGHVVDFIVLRPFPVLNVADIGITVGLIAFFATMLLYPVDSGLQTD